MYDLFQYSREFVKREEVCIDNGVFRLHSRVTVFILASCAMIISVKQFFGAPIECFSNDDGKQISDDAVKAYCWVFGTFTATSHLTGTPGRDNAGPGIGSSNNSEIIEQQYYKWVSLVFAIQAFIFYCPRALWGAWEKKTMKLLSENLTTPFLNQDEVAKKKDLLLDYFGDTSLHPHNLYAVRFLICEILNLVNTILQIFFLDFLLDGEFSVYGPAVSVFSTANKSEKLLNPMSKLFPLTGKCTIYSFGQSGSVQNRDFICILPLNLINEKIFVFIWFWFIFLISMGSLAIVYRLVAYTQEWARYYLMQAQIQYVDKETLQSLVEFLGFGDWFVLEQLSKNVNPAIFKEFIKELGIILVENQPKQAIRFKSHP